MIKKRYNKERVVLETDQGTCESLGHLQAVWILRIQKHFKHYKLVKVKFMKEKGKLKND